MMNPINGVPRISHSTFMRDYFKWGSGEHVALIGATGSGKTVYLRQLLSTRPWVTVFATKPIDESMDYLIHNHHYHKMKKWENLCPDNYPKRVLWPNAKSINSVAIQKQVFSKAFENIYIQGGWTIALDELRMFVEPRRPFLGFGPEVIQILTQGRSLNLSLIAGAQRPKFIPLEVYSQSTHLFFWRASDRSDIDRISEISHINKNIVKDIVPRLEQYECCYYNTRTGFVCRTKGPKPRIGPNKNDSTKCT